MPNLLPKRLNRSDQSQHWLLHIALRDNRRPSELSNVSRRRWAQSYSHLTQQSSNNLDPESQNQPRSLVRRLSSLQDQTQSTLQPPDKPQIGTQKQYGASIKRPSFQVQTQSSQEASINSKLKPQNQRRASSRRLSQLRVHPEQHELARDHTLKQPQSRFLQVFNESPLPQESSAGDIKLWKRAKGVHASIAAGVKPIDITLSDGSRVHVFTSGRRNVNILASGPRSSLRDLTRRLQEGKALSSKIDVDQLRSSLSDQTALKKYYSAQESSAALRTRRWIDDLSIRLKNLREQVIDIPSGPPLGDLAQDSVESRSDTPNKIHARTKDTKWISLAYCSPDDVGQNEEASQHCGPKEMKSNSAHSHSIDIELAPIDQTSSLGQLAPVASPPRSVLPSVNFESFWPSWTTRFEKMCRGIDWELSVLDKDSIKPLIETYAFTATPIKLLDMVWAYSAKLRSISQLEAWGDIMLWCLHNSQFQALRLLKATVIRRKFRPPQYVINDSLKYLADHFLGTSRPPDNLVMPEFLGVIRAILEADIGPKRHAQLIDSHVISLVLQRCNDEEARSLFDLCQECNVSLSVRTLLHALDRSTDMSHLSLSIQILQGVAHSGFDMSSDSVQNACLKLIRTQVSKDFEYHVRTKLMTELFEIGIVPSLPLYNAMILNAGEAGDFKTAWLLYQVGKANGLASDSTTYSNLLKSARFCRGAIAKRNPMKRVVHEVLGDPPAMQDLGLLHDILAAVSRQHKQTLSSSNSSFVFMQMLDIYKTFCNLAPLKDLQICSPDEIEPLSKANIKIQWPTPRIVGQMLALFAQVNSGKESLMNVFDRYRIMFLKGHPLATELSRSDFTANAFTMAFGQRPETLRHCSFVLKHMLEDSTSPRSTPDNDGRYHAASPSASKFSQQISSPGYEPTPMRTDTIIRKPCPPTVQTWSILLRAYINNGQKRAAEKIIVMMNERGIRPNKITWGSLISGYARMQDIGATVNAVDKMQAAGHRMDSRTARHLAELWNRRRLLKAFKTVTDPADSENKMAKKAKKPRIEIETQESEADKRKQKEAELFLAGQPSRLSENYDIPKAET